MQGNKPTVFNALVYNVLMIYLLPSLRNKHDALAETHFTLCARKMPVN